MVYFPWDILMTYFDIVCGTWVQQRHHAIPPCDTYSWDTAMRYIQPSWDTLMRYNHGILPMGYLDDILWHSLWYLSSTETPCDTSMRYLLMGYRHEIHETFMRYLNEIQSWHSYHGIHKTFMGYLNEIVWVKKGHHAIPPCDTRSWDTIMG